MKPNKNTLFGLMVLAWVAAHTLSLSPMCVNVNVGDKHKFANVLEFLATLGCMSANAFWMLVNGIGDCIERNHNGILAATLICIAFFMASLRSALKESAQISRDTAAAAKASADALPALERPYVFMRFSQGVFNTKERIAEILERGRVELSISFTNHGKTPAIVKDISYEIIHRDRLMEPSYANQLTQERIIRCFETIGSFEVALAELDGRTIENIREGESSIFFYGRLVYDDVFGVEHVTSFCWRYHGPSDTLETYGAEEWNQRT
jgi:hypothetical protein